MKKTRRLTLHALGVALALAGLSPALQARHDDDDDGFRSGKVFTSTNATAGNEVMVYDAAPEALAFVTRIATQGTGTGTGLGNQGAVTLSGDGRWLFVVNAGSHNVSTFRVRRGGVHLISVTPSGGLRPVSVTEHDGLVYVPHRPAPRRSVSRSTAAARCSCPKRSAVRRVRARCRRTPSRSPMPPRRWS